MYHLVRAGSVSWPRLNTEITISRETISAKSRAVIIAHHELTHAEGCLSSARCPPLCWSSEPSVSSLRQCSPTVWSQLWRRAPAGRVGPINGAPSRLPVYWPRWTGSPAISTRSQLVPRCYAVSDRQDRTAVTVRLSLAGCCVVLCVGVTLFIAAARR